MTTTYYGAFDSTDTPIGLFRMLKDDEAKTLSLERIDENGAWVDDPSLIEELHEPEVRLVSATDATKIQEELGALRGAESDGQEGAGAGSAVAERPPGGDRAAG